MHNDNDDDYTVYEDDGTESVTAPASPAAPSDEQILAFVQANIDNPALIAETAAQYGVSVADLSRATGYDPNVVVSYFEQHDVPPPAYTPPAVETREPPRPPDIIEREPPRPPEIPDTPTPPPRPEEPVNEPPRPPEKPVVEPPRPPKDIVERPVPPPPPPPPPPVVEPPKPPIKEIVEPPEDVVVAPTDKKVTPPAATAVTNTDATALPTLTDYQGKQYDGAQVLALAQQIANNAGTMTGGAFQTKGQSIGFDASEANKLLGRPATASEQVLLDMARQFIQTGVTDLSQLKTQEITGSASVGLDPDTGEYYALIPSADGETSTRKNLTPEQVAKIKTQEIFDQDGGASVNRTIDDLVTGKGLFANGKLLSQANAIDNPIEYTIGNTYTGGGGTSYQLKVDPKTGKPVVSASGFTTSDADSIMPIIMIASNFLLPGAGELLTGFLAETGMGELASQVVSKSIINGVTSGIMAEASGGSFGDGFLKGSVTGAVSAGVAPFIQTALPSDLSPFVANTLTKAGTAFVTALATGQDGTAALGRSLLSSATTGGLNLASGELGLSGEEAKLLTTVLSPILTQLVTTGNVDNSTLLNTVLMAGSTILANTGSEAVNNVSTLTTEDSGASGLSSLNSTVGTLNQLTSGNDSDVATGALTLMQNSGNDTLTDLASTAGAGLAAASTANGLLTKATSLTKPVSKVNKTKANLTGALTTKKPAATTNTALAKKSLTAQQVVAARPTSAPAKVNVANLTPIKKTVTTPPKKVDVSKLTPMKQVTGKG